MKKAFILTVMVLFLVSAMSLASAGTLIAGKIYNADFSDTVKNASVNVTCNEVSNFALSSDDGTYSVIFSLKDCDDGDTASVHAKCTDSNCRETDSNNVIVGENTIDGIVHDYSALMVDLNIGVVNVPLIPEFGLIVGMLTVLSAVTVFFVIRRK